MARKYLCLAAFLLPLVAAQTIVVDNTTLAATSDTVSPAYAQVNSTSSSSSLFSTETLQLTEDVLANLTALQLSNISVFGFATSSNDSTDAAAGSSSSSSSSKRASAGTCKTYPGDALWPSTVVWDVFDLLLGGALIKTVPVASPCYEDYGNYDEAACEWLTANWSNDSYWQTDYPSSFFAELYQNSTCLPPEIYPYDSTCTLGAFPAYSVNISTVAQIQLAVNLARNLNLRLVVKNTGHDFNGRSMGYGALSIWTHYLKDYEFYDSYTSGDYTGPALKAGTGLQAYEIYEACHEQGVTCIGGEGRTVGVMGGFIQGGGHSPLSTLYGMGADQILALEVVTPDGQFVTASAEQNTDLYWALRGGGGGTFGVVTSIVVKTYPKLPVTIMTFSFLNTTYGDEAFYSAIEAYWNGFVNWTDAGCYSYFFILPNLVAEGVTLFEMTPWFAPNLTQSQLETLVAPMFEEMAAVGVNITPTYQEFDNFYDAWDAGFALELWGTNTGRQGGRLFPKANWANETIRAQSWEAVRAVVQEDDGWVFGFNIAPGNALALDGVQPDNAVLPAWRQTVGHVLNSASWDVSDWGSEAGKAFIAAQSDKVTNQWGASWTALTPGSGAYQSECDYMQPEWQEAFWGSKYDRLLEIKQLYDPYELFYVHHGVGSEDWEVDSYIVGDVPSQAGKLCKI